MLDCRDVAAEACFSGTFSPVLCSEGLRSAGFRRYARRLAAATRPFPYPIVRTDRARRLPCIKSVDSCQRRPIAIRRGPTWEAPSKCDAETLSWLRRDSFRVRRFLGMWRSPPLSTGRPAVACTGRFPYTGRLSGMTRMLEASSPSSRGSSACRLVCRDNPEPSTARPKRPALAAVFSHTEL